MSDIALIKSALEFARFSDPEVREATTNLINQVDADLDELAYDSSVAVLAAVDLLNKAIEDAEDSESHAGGGAVEEEDIDDDDDIDENASDPTVDVEEINEDDDLED